MELYKFCFIKIRGKSKPCINTKYSVLIINLLKNRYINNMFNFLIALIVDIVAHLSINISVTPPLEKRLLYEESPLNDLNACGNKIGSKARAYVKLILEYIKFSVPYMRSMGNHFLGSSIVMMHANCKLCSCYRLLFKRRLIFARIILMKRREICFVKNFL